MAWYLSAMIGFIFACELARLAVNLTAIVRGVRMMRRLEKHRREAVAAIDAIGRSARAN